MNHELTYAAKAHDPRGGSILISDSTVNVVTGVVHSQQMGLAHTIVRIRAGRRVNMRISLATDDDRDFSPGQQVVAVIPAEAVRVEAGLFRRGRQRLNRWYGRLVLIKPLDEGQLNTAKLHGESWSLVSTWPVLGSIYSPRTWDPVNIVVDPRRIELFTARTEAPPEPKMLPIQHRFAFQQEKTVSAYVHYSPSKKEHL